MASFVYFSPVGHLHIQSENGFISEIIFLNENKEDDNSEAEINDEILLQCKQELDEYFAGNREIFSVPIQQKGTNFQEKVWDELMNIPFGETISYGELSVRLKNPKAIRAVGTANGSNHLPIIVPCHRVIGANGKLVGYGGGLWRKKWLLEHERSYVKNAGLLF